MSGRAGERRGGVDPVEADNDPITRMTDEHRKLIGVDKAFEERWWGLMRMMWILMAVAIAGGLSGACGRGPAARAHASQGGVEVQYERVARYQTPTRLTMTLPPSSQARRLFVGDTLLDRIQLESVLPRPERTEAHRDGAILVFPAGGEPARIVLVAQPASIGVETQRVGLEGAPISFRQLVVP